MEVQYERLEQASATLDKILSLWESIDSDLAHVMKTTFEGLADSRLFLDFFEDKQENMLVEWMQIGSEGKLIQCSTVLSPREISHIDPCMYSRGFHAIELQFVVLVAINGPAASPIDGPVASRASVKPKK